MATPAGWQYYIFDTTKKAGAWVSLGETGHPFVVTSAPVGKDSVVIESSNSGRIALTLREAKTVASGRESRPTEGFTVSLQPASSGEAQIAEEPTLTPKEEERQRRIDSENEEKMKRRYQLALALQAASPQAGPH